MSDYYLDPATAAAYDREPFQMKDDVPFYLELAKEAGAAGQPVLEIACGTGRITIPIAQAGVEVVGLDNSEAMLAIAHEKSRGLANLTWVQGDMRDFRLEQRFGLVMIPYRSFLVLLTVADQKACLTRIHEHLLPGGRLALNFFNPDLLMIAEWLSSRRGGIQRMGGQELEGGRRREYWQSNSYDLSRQEVFHTRLTEELSDDGAVIRRAYKNLHLRYVFRYEMEHLLALCGFSLDALYGWFDKQPFGPQSSELIWVARKP